MRARLGIAGVAVAIALGVSAPALATTRAPDRHVASLATTIPAWPLVKSGSTGAQVRSVQYLLNARGARLAVDGVFGQRTAAALAAFQRAHHLPASARTTPATWGALIVVVARGSLGSAVRAVQDQVNVRNLKGSGYLAVDGIFGSKTDAAVRNLQTSWKLRATGIVGPITWRYLVSEYQSG